LEKDIRRRQARHSELPLFFLDRNPFKAASLLFLNAVFIAASFAQTKSDEGMKQAPPIKVRTELVLIPAVVTDSKGKRVTDLKKEDFAVLENGKRQEIALFEHVTTNAEVLRQPQEAEGVYTNAVVRRQDRVTIFVLDLLNSSIEEQRTARKELIDFLSKSLDIHEPLCLIAVDSNGAWMIHDFTTDPAVLAKALTKVKEEMSDKDREVQNPGEGMFRGVQGWHSHNSEQNLAQEQSRLDMLRMTFGLQDLGLAERIRITLLSLMEIGDAFAGVPGRKSLIWATAGFPFDIGDAAVFQRGGSMERLGDHGFLSLYERTWRALNAANIAVYPLDESELVNPGYVNAGTGEPLPDHVTLDTHVANLETFADVTGGRLCDRSMDPRKCFDQAAKDSSDYYLLGIYDPGSTEKSGWRRLSVRTLRPDLHVKARGGYYIGRTLERPSDTTELEMALFSPVDYTALPVSVRLKKPTESGKPGMKTVRFVYSIPAGAFQLGAEDGDNLQVEFAAVARDPVGKMVGDFRKNVQGKLTNAQLVRLREKGLLFTGSMELPPGEYTLSFAVLDTVNNNSGSVTAPLKVE
jgi:VWFA-related protein